MPKSIGDCDYLRGEREVDVRDGMEFSSSAPVSRTSEPSTHSDDSPTAEQAPITASEFRSAECKKSFEFGSPGCRKRVESGSPDQRKPGELGSPEM
jgi:hypothetical protein